MRCCMRNGTVLCCVPAVASPQAHMPFTPTAMCAVIVCTRPFESLPAVAQCQWQAQCMGEYQTGAGAGAIHSALQHMKCCSLQRQLHILHARHQLAAVSTHGMPDDDCVPFRLKGPEEIQAVFQAAGVDLKQPVVASCGTGVTASVLALALHQLTPKPQVWAVDQDQGFVSAICMKPGFVFSHALHPHICMQSVMLLLFQMCAITMLLGRHASCNYCTMVCGLPGANFFFFYCLLISINALPAHLSACKQSKLVSRA